VNAHYFVILLLEECLGRRLGYRYQLEINKMDYGINIIEIKVRDRI